MRAAHTADMITELEELVSALTWDARNAEGQARFQRAHEPSMGETARMTRAREAYAAAFDAVAAAGNEFSAACQQRLDQLRGVR